MTRVQRGRPARTMVRIEVAALLAISLFSIGWRTIAFAVHGTQSRVDILLLGNADWFAYGMGLALATVGLAGRERESRVVRVDLRPRVAAVGAGGLPVVAGRDPARHEPHLPPALQRRPHGWPST